METVIVLGHFGWVSVPSQAEMNKYTLKLEIMLGIFKSFKIVSLYISHTYIDIYIEGSFKVYSFIKPRWLAKSVSLTRRPRVRMLCPQGP